MYNERCCLPAGIHVLAAFVRPSSMLHRFVSRFVPPSASLFSCFRFAPLSFTFARRIILRNDTTDTIRGERGKGRDTRGGRSKISNRYPPIVPAVRNVVYPKTSLRFHAYVHRFHSEVIINTKMAAIFPRRSKISVFIFSNVSFQEKKKYHPPLPVEKCENHSLDRGNWKISKVQIQLIFSLRRYAKRGTASLCVSIDSSTNTGYQIRKRKTGQKRSCKRKRETETETETETERERKKNEISRRREIASRSHGETTKKNWRKIKKGRRKLIVGGSVIFLQYRTRFCS